MIRHRFFDADEFEHTHAAWCVFRGMLPYKDFFEHHTPWYYYALRPFFHWFDVATSVESARHFLLFGRALSLALAILSTFALSQIGRLWEHREVGILAGLFLVSQPVFFRKAIEMRPDVLALPCFLGCLWLLLREITRRTVGATNGLRCMFGAGLSLGAAIMCTQKMLFVVPGALAGVVLWSLSDGTARESLEGFHPGGTVGIRTRMLRPLTFIVGICVPTALTWAAFARHHAGDTFIKNNFLLNAKWKHIETHQLGWLIHTSWPILALSLLGVSAALWNIFRFRGRPYGGLLLIFTLLGLMGGSLFIPSAYSQYYLMPLPLICLFAAKGLLLVLEGAPRRTRPGLLMLTLIALGVLPGLTLRESFGLNNDGQIARLRYVFENTRPGDIVMDGWQGLGVFRPHAFYYFFLHPETVAMLPTAQLDAYLNDLERRRIRPRLIAMDRNLRALGTRFERFVHRNYLSKDGFFYFPIGSPQPHQGGPLHVGRGF